MRPWTEAALRVKTVTLELQWGHGLAAVDGSARHIQWRIADKLQWGHGLAAVDGGVGVVADNRHGQLQWGHGLAAVDGQAGGAVILE